MHTTEDIIKMANEAVSQIHYNGEPHNLYDPIRYILSIGGKRVRPALMLMAYNLYRDDIESIMNNAMGLEVYHNFTLIHDDLMDKSDLRRGNPTVHKRWDENTAILSGDTMLIMAYKLFSQGKQCSEATKAFIDATEGVCEGQQYDMDFEKRNDVTEDDYMNMIRLKTSLLLGYAVKIGALLGGADKEDADNLYAFGEKMGLAYQLQDDLLDVYGDTAQFKKKLGADIVDNKKTMLLIKAYDLAGAEMKEELDKWIKAETFDAEKKIAAVTRIYNALGIPSLIHKRIEELFNESLKSLNAVKVEDGKKTELKKFADMMLGRKY